MPYSTKSADTQECRRSTFSLHACEACDLCRILCKATPDDDTLPAAKETLELCARPNTATTQQSSATRYPKSSVQLRTAARHALALRARALPSSAFAFAGFNFFRMSYASSPSA